MTAADCVFCKVLRGEMPSEKVAEGERWVAILDIRPVRPGHTLVLSKEHVESLTGAPAAVAADLLAAVQKLAPALLRATGSDAFNVMINNGRPAGQLVPHLHFHIVPRKADDGVKFGWRQNPYPEGEMAKTADAIRRAL